MRRRDLIAMLGGAAVWGPQFAGAQPKQPVVAIFYPASEDVGRPNLEAFRSTLLQRGYEEGRNLEIVVRYLLDNDQEAMRRIGAELVALAPAVIVAGGRLTSLAVHKLTTSIPIVIVSFNGDPIVAGLVKTFAHPGGNVTGTLLTSNVAIAGKQLALLKELVPTAVRVDSLSDASGNEEAMRALVGAARELKIELRTTLIERRDQIAPAIARARGYADAIYFGSSPLFNTMRTEIAALAAKVGLPAIYTAPEIVEAGGLFGYGGSIRKQYASGAEYVARILGGATPADLPIEQPREYVLSINLKTAKSLGLAIPPTLLARADEVIE